MSEQKWAVHQPLTGETVITCAHPDDANEFYTFGILDGKLLKSECEFADGRVVIAQWAILCPACHADSLKSQRYFAEYLTKVCTYSGPTPILPWEPKQDTILKTGHTVHE